MSLFPFTSLNSLFLKQEKADSGEECTCRVYNQSPETCFLGNLTVGFAENVKWFYICCAQN